MADRPSLFEMLGQTWPARLAKSAYGAVTLPGDVYAGKVDPLSEEGIGRAADLGGMVMGGTYAAAPAGAMGAGAVKPIRAYHGSPYDFERFDLSKIGTGEGAQSYGHGLYFAENPKTAQSYRDALAKPGAKYVDDVPYNRDDPAHLAANLLNTYKGKGDARAVAISELRQDVNNPALIPERRAIYAQAADLLETGKPLGQYRRDPSGRMYEVNIRAEPEQFLDWDKALSEMSPEVQKALSGFSPHMTGAQINESARLVPGAYRDNRVATENLRERGIPGIKYLDQGSRPHLAAYEAELQKYKGLVEESRTNLKADPNNEALRQTLIKNRNELNRIESVGPGTSNYVLFRDDIIDIVKKYGLAAAAAMYGISQDEAKAMTNDGKDKPKAKLNIGRQSYGEE